MIFSRVQPIHMYSYDFNDQNVSLSSFFAVKEKMKKQAMESKERRLWPIIKSKKEKDEKTHELYAFGGTAREYIPICFHKIHFFFICLHMNVCMYVHPILCWFLNLNCYKYWLDYFFLHISVEIQHTTINKQCGDATWLRPTPNFVICSSVDP